MSLDNTDLFVRACLAFVRDIEARDNTSTPTPTRRSSPLPGFTLMGGRAPTHLEAVLIAEYAQRLWGALHPHDDDAIIAHHFGPHVERAALDARVASLR